MRSFVFRFPFRLRLRRLETLFSRSINVLHQQLFTLLCIGFIRHSEVAFPFDRHSYASRIVGISMQLRRYWRNSSISHAELHRSSE